MPAKSEQTDLPLELSLNEGCCFNLNFANSRLRLVEEESVEDERESPPDTVGIIYWTPYWLYESVPLRGGEGGSVKREVRLERDGLLEGIRYITNGWMESKGLPEFKQLNHSSRKYV